MAANLSRIDEEAYLVEMQKRALGRSKAEKTKNRHRRMRGLLEQDNGAEELAAAVRTAAKAGDTAAMRLMFSYMVPVTQLSDERIEGAADLAHLPPDARMIEIARRVTTGDLPVSHGEVLTKMAQAEIDSSAMKFIRMAVDAARSGKPLNQVVDLIARIDLHEVPDYTVVETVPAAPDEDFLS